MAGIVKSTKRRFLIGKRIKEVEVPGTELDTDLFFADVIGVGGSTSESLSRSELTRLPNIVKNESVLTLVSGAYKTGASYAFNGDTKSIDEFAFERNSSGLRFFQGALASMPNNTQRQDYDPSNNAYKGIIFEKASTNLITDSGILDGLNSFTSRSNVCLTAVDTGFGLGIWLAKGIKFEWHETETIWTYKTYVFTEGTPYVFSFFIKMDDGSLPTPDDLRIRVNGLYLSVAASAFTHLGNGVYRYSRSFIGMSTGSQLYSLGFVKQPGNSNKPFIVSGLQLEEGSIATSYIPTTTAASVRLADKLTSNRPIAVYPKNSFYIESSGYTGWFGNGIDGLNILGRNYLSRPDQYRGTFTAGITFNSFDSRSISVTFPVVAGTPYFSLLNYPITPGIHTLSFKVRITTRTAASDITLERGLRGPTVGDKRSVIVTGVWTEISEIYEVVNPSSSIIFFINSSTAQLGVTLELADIKLERGSVATPWSPAPEDLVQIDANGNLKVESNGSDHLRSLSLVPRGLTQEEI